MRYLFWLITAIIVTVSVPVVAVDLTPLVDCSLKVFRVINRTKQWSGKVPEGCSAEIYVEKRGDGIFVTAWNKSASEQGWVRVSLSSALGYYEVADKKTLEKAGRDVRARAARIERCLDSIIRVNDPLECRDHATKTYSAGGEIGVENKRSIWLDDNGRHIVVEYAYGDARGAVTPSVDLFSGPALPPGTNLNINIFYGK